MSESLWADLRSEAFRMRRERFREFPLHIRVACCLGWHTKIINLADVGGPNDKFCHYCIARR